MITEQQTIAILATNPFAILNHLTQIPNLAITIEAADESDQILDTIPRLIVAVEPEPKKKNDHYKHPIHLDIIDILQHEKRTITPHDVSILFGLQQNHAADHLYNMEVLGLAVLY